MVEVSGTVRSAEGNPVEGVLVMGADLNYAETDTNGKFRLFRPEMVLFFWCSGFLPRACILKAGEPKVDVVLRRAATLRASA